MFSDLHIHPSYSIDAKGELDEFVNSAIKKKISQICFTTHIDLEPSRQAMDRFISLNGKIEYLTKKSVSEYIENVRSIAERYKGILDIRVGFEIGWTSDAYGVIKDFLSELDIDFRIGSVHIIDGIAITSKKEAIQYFKKHSLEEIASKYYDELAFAAQSGLFDVLGHIDGYKKYLPLVFGDKPLEYKDEDLILKLIRACKENKVTFELNTSSILKGHKEFYPSQWILDIARKNGVETISLGSDAHSPEFVGFMFDEAYKTLQNYGFKTYFIEKSS